MCDVGLQPPASMYARAFERVPDHLPVAARDLARERLALVLRSLAARLHLLRAHPARVEQLLLIQHDPLLALRRAQPHHNVEVAWAHGAATGRQAAKGRDRAGLVTSLVTSLVNSLVASLVPSAEGACVRAWLGPGLGWG